MAKISLFLAKNIPTLIDRRGVSRFSFVTKMASLYIDHWYAFHPKIRLFWPQGFFIEVYGHYFTWISNGRGVSDACK